MLPQILGPRRLLLGHRVPLIPPLTLWTNWCGPRGSEPDPQGQSGDPEGPAVKARNSCPNSVRARISAKLCFALRLSRGTRNGVSQERVPKNLVPELCSGTHLRETLFRGLSRRTRNGVSQERVPKREFANQESGRNRIRWRRRQRRWRKLGRGRSLAEAPDRRRWRHSALIIGSIS